MELALLEDPYVHRVCPFSTGEASIFFRRRQDVPEGACVQAGRWSWRQDLWRCQVTQSEL